MVRAFWSITSEIHLAPPESSPAPVPSPSRPSAREFVLIACAVVGLVGGVLLWVGWQPGREAARGSLRTTPLGTAVRSASYVGDRACRACHPGEAALHSRSGHARTLRPAAESPLAHWLDGRRAGDPGWPGVTWEYSLRDRRLVVERRDEGAALAERLTLDYAFGSARHAGTSFVTLTDTAPAHPSGLEHRLSYFASDGSLGLTPGQAARPERGTHDEWTGRRLDGRALLTCFHCHTTLTSSRGPTVLDVATMVPNVSCERCHGPGRAHVAASQAGDSDLTMPFGLDQGTADAQLRLCGECHRHPENFSASMIRADDARLVRFQPVGLMQALCYRRSHGSLRCTTCHDPHARPSHDPLGYEAACLSCHQAAPQAVCPISARTGCIACHMPRRETGPQLVFTDHWIRVADPSGIRPK
jgi:hypothetical protein